MSTGGLSDCVPASDPISRRGCSSALVRSLGVIVVCLRPGGVKAGEEAEVVCHEVSVYTKAFRIKYSCDECIY